MSKLTEVQKNKRYRQFKKYKVICKLPSAEQYCKKHDGSPCCFFLQRQADVQRSLSKRAYRL